MEKILRFGIYIIFLLPLLVGSGLFSAFIFPKVIAFRIIIEIMFLIYLLLILKDKRYLPRLNLIFISLTIFLAVYFLTSISGVNFYQSFWGTLVRMGGFFSLLHYWVFFVILISLFKTKENWLSLFKFSIFVSLLITLYGFCQELGFVKSIGIEFERIHGTIGNPTFFAGYVLFHIFLALMFVAKKGTSIVWRFFFIFTAGLESLAIFMSGARGTLLALMIGLFLFSVLVVFLKKQIEMKKIIIFICASLLVFVILVSIASNLIEKESIKARTIGWKIAWQGWKEKFLLGWGPENFNLVFNKYFNPSFFYESESENQWDRAHNIILELGSTMGLVGLISYLSILAFAFYVLLKKLRLITGCMAIILVVNFIHNLFIFDLFSSYILLFSILGFVSFLTLKSSKPLQASKPRNLSALAVIILLIIFSAIIYQTNIKPFLANSNVFKANFKKALEYQTFVRFHVRKKLASVVIQESRTRTEIDTGLQQAFQLAIQEMKKSIDENSVDYLHYLYLGTLYNRSARLGDESYLDDTEDVLKKALELSPTRQQILFQLGEAKLIQKDYDSAVEIFQQALDFHLDAQESYWRLGLAEVEAGKIEQGINNIKKSLKLIPNVPDITSPYVYTRLHWRVLTLIEYLAKTQEYEKIIALYELAVLNDYPGKARTYASLAAAYAAVGEFERAILSAREAARIDPSFKEESEVFIQSLYE